MSNNHPTTMSDEVMDLVHTLMHRFRSLQYQALRDTAQDLTHLETKVLLFFARRPGATQSDLAQHSGRDKAQLAKLIKSLRERGLLDAVPDPQDRRNILLELSEQGREVQRHLAQQARRLGAQAVAGLAAAEQRELVALLRRVQDNLAPPG